MIIFGIDPSLVSTGICVMDERGKILESITLGSKQKGVQRLVELAKKLEQLCLKYDYDPHCTAFIEGYSFGSTGKGMLNLAEWGGIIRYTLYLEEIEFVEIAPAAVKKFATGKGNADKIAVALGVSKHFGQEFKTSDQTDAFVLAEIGRAYLGYYNGLTGYREEVVKKLKGA